jgi:hypothetical protein
MNEDEIFTATRSFARELGRQGIALDDAQHTTAAIEYVAAGSPDAAEYVRGKFSPPAPQTLASMTAAERMAYAREVGSAAYSKRLVAESAEPARPSVWSRAPREAAAAVAATAGLPDDAVVDLPTLDDAQRDAWIRRHGLARYSALLREQLRGKHGAFPQQATWSPQQQAMSAAQQSDDAERQRLAEAADARRLPPDADLASMDDGIRRDWIARHGIHAYNRLLREQLKGRRMFR